MAKTLELHFTCENGKVTKLTVDNPVEPVDPSAVQQVMEQIVTSEVFCGTNGNFVSAAEARLIEHNVTPYEFA